MTPVEIGFFGLTLFLSLSALLIWKERRQRARERMNQNLRGYVHAEHAPEMRDGESLIAA